MGGSIKEQLDLLEQKIKYTFRPLINAINTSGMNRERRLQFEAVLRDISHLQQKLENHIERLGSTEGRIRLTGLVDYLRTLTKGAGISASLPERRKHLRYDFKQQGVIDEGSLSKNIQIINLSRGGLRLHSPTSMNVGSVSHLKMQSSKYGVIPLKGEVVWCKEDETGKGYFIGVHFLEMDEDVANALESHLDGRAGQGMFGRDGE